MGSGIETEQNEFVLVRMPACATEPDVGSWEAAVKHSDIVGILSMSVACVDDDPAQAQTISRCVTKLGCSVTVFDEPEKCKAALTSSGFDIIIASLRMAEMDAIELLDEVKRLSPSTDVIIVAGDTDKKMAIDAVRRGAFDYFDKPVCEEEVVESVKRTIRYRTAIRERDELTEQVVALSFNDWKHWGLHAMIGNSDTIRRIVREVGTLRSSQNTSVLITGENGTGKELVARAIHYSGPRRLSPFVPLNCTAVPAELVESALFGHRKGSFTGALEDRKGYFDIADGGTLFLDEIGDMPAAMQSKLLRVLDDHMITPVGSSRDHPVNVRVIAATNSDLGALVADGKFRTDLFYRLSAYELRVPPLRERRDDIVLLAAHFMKTLSAEMGIAVQKLGEDAIAILNGHDYPGNVRELKNVIERALIESGGIVGAGHIHFPNVMRRSASIRPVSEAPKSEGVTANDPTLFSLKTAEEHAIRRALKAANENLTEAAHLLGISRSKLYRRLNSMEK